MKWELFIKVKLKVTIQQATKLRGTVDYSSTLYLTSALDGGGWSTPRPGTFTPWKDSVPIVVCSRVGLEVCGRSRPHQDSIPGPSIP